jgi:hypothetical protein
MKDQLTGSQMMEVRSSSSIFVRAGTN